MKSPYKNGYPYKSGFTLIELVIVLFIVAIGASVVAVSISRAYEKTVIKREAVRLRNTLKQARDLSLIERRPIVFALDEENGEFWLEKNGVFHGKPRRVPEGFTLRGGQIVFLPKGDSTGGTVSIMDAKGRGYFIEVDAVTGSASLKRL